VSRGRGDARRAAEIACAALLALAGAAPLRAERIGDVDVTALQVSDAETTHGYMEYPIRLINRSGAREHTVSVTLPATSHSSYAQIARMTRTVTLQPGATVELRVFHPPLRMSGDGIRVEVDGTSRVISGPAYKHMHGGSYHYGGYGRSNQQRFVLVSRSIDSRDVEDSFAQWQRTATSGAELLIFAGDRPPRDWSDQWLGYSCYDAVMLTADDWSSLSPGVRTALTQYMETGGALMLVGDFEMPEAWRRRVEGGGDQRVAHIAFGQVLALGDGDPDGWTSGRWDRLWRVMSDTRNPYDDISRSPVHANMRFPVIDDLGVPVRGLFLLMIIFAALIGPVNLIVLTRRKRRIWMLWTVPVISLVMCGAVFAYNAMSEGWSSTARYRTMTILDQRTQRASTLGVCAFYAPLTPGDGLRFGDDTELTPHVDTDSTDSARRTVNWTNGQHLASGWVTSRVPAHFSVRRSQRFLDRVDLRVAPDGSWSATNGLGVAIEELHFAAPDGAIYRAAGLDAGATVTLRPTGTRVTSSDGDRFRKWYTGSWIDLAGRINARHLERGDYVAILESTPFIEPGMGATVRPTTSTVYGLTKHSR